MQAIAIGYELRAAPTGGESVAAAMAAGKLMGLDEDRLANALTMALTPHVALNKGVGAMSMWKGTRSAEAMKCGVWAALLAREVMAGNIVLSEWNEAVEQWIVRVNCLAKWWPEL